MGASISKTATAATAAAPAEQTFAARCDEVTDAFLAAVCQSRAGGALRSVTLDCRRSGFDEVAVERASQAAGGKVVLQL